MSDKQLSAGDSVESRCTKCRTVMNHTIVAMVDGKPGRVECNTCKGIHNYRPPVAEKTAKTPATPRKRTTRKVDPDPAAWEALSLNNQSGRAADYSMKAEYKLDEIVNHSVFGLGQVVKLVPPNKVEILFQDGRKLLRCG
jgi:hypothetical protein